MFFMKNKGQGTAVVVILLVVIAIVLIVIAYILFNKPATTPTGQVIFVEDTSDVSKYLATEVCSMGPPFICSDSSVAKTTGIELILMNGGDNDVVVDSIEITNCGSADYSNTINSGESQKLIIPCKLKAGSSFRGNIVITYNNINQATGSITRYVM